MEGKIGVGRIHKLGGGDTADTLLMEEKLGWEHRTTLKDQTPSRHHHTDTHEKLHSLLQNTPMTVHDKVNPSQPDIVQNSCN